MSKMLFRAEDKSLSKGFLGIELGSTRIKSVLIDENYNTIASGDYSWESSLIDGIWSYPLEDAENGVKTAVKALLENLNRDIDLQSVGLSGMMHGYLAFDENWNLLVPFRTWQNTMTREASEILIDALNFNIPQRYSIAHLLQAILNKEEHLPRLAHMTTLAGYIHYKLTGENVVCIDEASGMFPIDSVSLGYEMELLDKTQKLLGEYGFTKKLIDILPSIKVAGELSGTLSSSGAEFLGGMLPTGVPFAAPTGDGGTGMVATNTVAPKTGNVSAGTSIFADIVLEHPLRKLYPEIDIVATPSGRDVAEIHGNNCTNDMNIWVRMFKELIALFGGNVSENELFTKLYLHSLEGDADCGEVTVVNYMAGECITHLDDGRPLVIRTPGSRLNLSNFVRSHLYSLFATLKIGIDFLDEEGVKIDCLMGHGGVFKTQGVGQRYLAAACNTAVTCMENAGEGGPYGMALLCAYMSQRDECETLEDFLNNRVFKDVQTSTAYPQEEDVAGFKLFMDRFKRCMKVEETAVEVGL